MGIEKYGRIEMNVFSFRSPAKRTTSANFGNRSLCEARYERTREFQTQLPYYFSQSDTKVIMRVIMDCSSHDSAVSAVPSTRRSLLPVQFKALSVTTWSVC